MENNNYLTINEASKILGVDKTTLRRWDKAGKLKTARNPMNNYRIYYKKDIQLFLTLNTRLTYKSLIEIVADVYKELLPRLDCNLQVVLRKILSNVEASNILIENDLINEAFIILRSSLESTVLFAYLMENSDYIIGYTEDSQLLGFKNNFIEYKKYKEDKDNEIFKDTLANFNEEALIQENERLFNEILCKNNKELILKKTKLFNYQLNEENIKKLDNFFTHYKPLYMRLEDLYKGVKKSELLQIELRTLLFSIYNENSQIAHGRFHDWAHLKRFRKMNECEIEILKSELLRIIMIPIIVCKENKIFISSESENNLKNITKTYYPYLYSKNGKTND